MKLVNAHERKIVRPLSEVFADLVALGTPADRIWPEPRMPFRRSPGAMQVGVTRERHGAIRGLLADYREDSHIVWRVDQPFLHGTHAFEVEARGGATLVRHVIRADLAWWFAPVWHGYVGGLHDRILEALLDRLEAAGQSIPKPA